MNSDLRLKAYATALSAGRIVQSRAADLTAGLCGRLIRGKNPADFTTLTDDPKRKLVMLLGPDGLSGLLGLSGYEMLIAIGYTEEHIRRKVIDEGNSFKLVVFPEGGPAKLATWDNVIEIVTKTYPALRDVLQNALGELRSMPYARFETAAGYAFAEADKAGSNDPRFVSYDKLLARGSNPPAWMVRAFLHHTVHLRELFSGDGYTYTADGRRGLMEYIVANCPICDLGDHVIIDIDVQVPGGMKGATAMPTKRQPYELPIPSFYDRKAVADWKWLVKYPDRFKDALGWIKKHNVVTAAKDDLRIALMPIDTQLTFCHPDFELYVGGKSGTGAIDDTARLCEFIYRNLKVLTKIYPTMDTHTAYQIFHAAFLINDQGDHPDPRYPTQITAEDIVNGKWKVDPRAAYAITGDPAKYGALQEHLNYYAQTLKNGGKYALTVWPFHAMLGSQGHALMPSLDEAIFFHTIARGSQATPQIKGGNPLTENYSVLRPEVLTGARGNSIGQKNVAFLKALLENDVVIIAGQAKSHCVAWTIEDLLQEILQQDPALARKVYLLDDCTSSVVVPNVIDFTQQGEDAFARFAAAGMHVVKSTTPISEWPDIDESRLQL